MTLPSEPRFRQVTMGGNLESPRLGVPHAIQDPDLGEWRRNGQTEDRQTEGRKEGRKEDIEKLLV